jgi:hypothetical protein
MVVYRESVPATPGVLAVPLKIIASRNSKTPYLYIRGAYLGIRVDQSWRTDRRSVANTILKRIEGEIERGEYQKVKIEPRVGPTFLSAALAYLEAGRRKRYVAKLIKHFGETPLSSKGDRRRRDRTPSQRRTGNAKRRSLHAGLRNPPSCRRRSENEAPEGCQGPRRYRLATI